MSRLSSPIRNLRTTVACLLAWTTTAQQLAFYNFVTGSSTTATSSMFASSAITIVNAPSGSAVAVGSSSSCGGTSGRCLKCSSTWTAFIANTTYFQFSVTTSGGAGGFTPTNFSVYLSSSSSNTNSMNLQYAGSPAGPFTQWGPMLTQTTSAAVLYTVQLPPDPVLSNAVNATFRLVLTTASGLMSGSSFYIAALSV